MYKITIGMPTYDDFDGVYFTINAIRLFHPEVVDDIEFLVVDNHPSGLHAAMVKDFVKNIGGFYVPFDKWTSTSVGKNLVFKFANAPYAMCVDSHILIAPGAIARLIEYFEQNGDCRDLLQGPLLNNNMTVSTHFEPVWRGQMWGTWSSDKRGRDRDSPPFEIPMQGTGLMACRKDAWLGFNDLFRGFGAQAGYIHEKYKKAGRRTICLPFLRWMHRFGRPDGAKYQVSATDKFRNYIIGFKELNLDTEPLFAQFKPAIKENKMIEIVAEVEDKMSPTPSVACLMMTYNRLPHGSKLLNEAIHSFHQQNYKKKELIVVNDCPGQIINYDHPDVVVINVSRRFESLGDKFNFAASFTRADLLCIWDDDDISLPWRLSQAVERLGDHRCWQPEAHWAMNNDVLTYVDMRGQLPAKGIFTHELFDQVGGFLSSSYGIDRDLQSKMLASGSARRQSLSREECSYIYRFHGTGSYHHTGAIDKYEKVGELKIAECIFIPEPYWISDYVRLVENAGQTAETAPG